MLPHVSISLTHNLLVSNLNLILYRMIVKMLHAEEFSQYTKCGWETFSFASSGQKKLFLVLPIFYFRSLWCPEKEYFFVIDHNTSSKLNSLILKFCLWLLLSYLHLSHQMKMGRSYTWCGDWKRKFCDKRLAKKINYYWLFMSKGIE